MTRFFERKLTKSRIWNPVWVESTENCLFGHCRSDLKILPAAVWQKNNYDKTLFRQEYIFITFRFFVLGYIIYFYVQRRESDRVDHWLSPVYAAYLCCHFGSRSSQCNSHKHRDQIIRCVISTLVYVSNDSHVYTQNLSKIRDIDRGIRDCAINVWMWFVANIWRLGSIGFRC